MEYSEIATAGIDHLLTCIGSASTCVVIDFESINEMSPNLYLFFHVYISFHIVLKGWDTESLKPQDVLDFVSIIHIDLACVLTQAYSVFN